MAEELKDGYQRNITGGTSNDTIIDKNEQRSIETKVGQIEIKIESLSDKLDNSINTKKWILVSIISIVALALTVGSFVANLIFNYNQHIFEIQKNYNEQTIEIRKEFNSEYNYLNSKKMDEEINKIGNQEKIIDCFKNRRYWQFEDCLK